MSDRSFLSWPFFEDKHRALADDLDAWAAGNLATLDHSDTDALCRDLVRMLGEAGYLKHSGALDGQLDVRSLCLIRETLARHDGLADFSFAMQGLGTGAISLFGTGEQQEEWLPKTRSGEAISAFALTEPQSGSDVASSTMTAMPDGNGLEMLPKIASERPGLPVIVISAQNTIMTAIKAAEADAFDYLPKPFEPKELLLRINAILRRMPETEAADTTPKVLHLGPVRYDIERGEMWNGDDIVRLTATEAQLMRIFSKNVGEPVSRVQLVEELGRDRGQAQERAVDVQITRLRRKIEVDPKQPRYMQTVRGAGYMLAPD